MGIVTHLKMCCDGVQCAGKTNQFMIKLLCLPYSNSADKIVIVCVNLCVTFGMDGRRREKEEESLWSW